MATVRIVDFGRVISDDTLGQQILTAIEEALAVHPVVTIDFSDVISMATFCSKQIFGKLYVDMTPKVFFEKIRIANASEDLRIVVRLGIEKALESQTEKAE